MNKLNNKKVSLSAVLTMLVVGIVLVACTICVGASVQYYRKYVEANAITSSDQAVSQVHKMISNYTDDMNEVMEMIRENISQEDNGQVDFYASLINIRKDVEAVMLYSPDGELLNHWVNGQKIKENISNNLSYEPVAESGKMYISAPHVQNLFQDYYPWVVTISEQMETKEGEEFQIIMDIRFSNIASYVDEVGIGTHGYCFITDSHGNIVYHPQQQLIYAGLKAEETERISQYEDGSHISENVIYTIHTLENCDWRIVGVSYVDELITSKMTDMAQLVVFLLLIVVITTAIAVVLLTRLFSRPAKDLMSAMRRFEREGEEFEFYPLEGTYEIEELSDSFSHMVLRIQELMERVRQEEVSLRKTELNALQAQINPHFLYNTLDSIAWMCEEGRNQEAVEMVNALARLFRISISKGHELITIERELQHAQAYLMIQKYRYKDQFTYHFQVEDTCLQYLCNKITLQPLIENAINHGLDASEPGEILIEVREKDGDIIMAVADNGIGMSKEQCEAIWKTDTNSKSGIGIKNVNDRIRIYFGEKYGLNIISELDEGTRVEIRMPKVLEESYGK